MGESMTPIDWNDSEPTFPDFLPTDGVHPMSEALTGNRRFRKVDYGRLGTSTEKLVLQVEFTVFAKTTGKWKTMWRDAKPEDITPAETVIG
jgi:hypothetical protein